MGARHPPWIRLCNNPHWPIIGGIKRLIDFGHDIKWGRGQTEGKVKRGRGRRGARENRIFKRGKSWSIHCIINNNNPLTYWLRRIRIGLPRIIYNLDYTYTFEGYQNTGVLPGSFLEFKILIFCLKSLKKQKCPWIPWKITWTTLKQCISFTCKCFGSGSGIRRIRYFCPDLDPDPSKQITETDPGVKRKNDFFNVYFSFLDDLKQLKKIKKCWRFLESSETWKKTWKNSSFPFLPLIQIRIR